MRIAVSAVLSGLLLTNLNALTAAASYEVPQPNIRIPEATATAQLNGASSTQDMILQLQASVSALSKRMGHEASSSAVDVPQPSQLDVWLEALALQESGNRAKIKVLDSNGRYSYGCLQFQMATFKTFMRQYGIGDASTNAQWLALIYNCSTQKQLAKAMIKDNYTAWQNWRNTVLRKGVGLPPAGEGLAIAK